VREALGYEYFEEFCLGAPESNFNLAFLGLLFGVTSS